MNLLFEQLFADTSGMPLNTSYRFPINQQKLISLLAFTATFLLCAHTLFYVYNYWVEEAPWYLIQLFDVNEEHNLPTWFSGFNLVVSTFFLWIITRQKREDGDSMAGRWMMLFGVFCFLSIDEIAGMHESINSVTDPTWAYGGAVIALGFAIYFLSFLKSLPRKTLIQFIVAGGLFVGGAVGMEIVGDPMDGDSLLYNMMTMVEEGMEMFGIILFTRALLLYMGQTSLNPELS
ncbi:MAG TPA: hypothetical protein DCY57_00700 [Bacteroidetes bacterium]|nr:hypothetical protein [Bacteroidota bacterium]